MFSLIIASAMLLLKSYVDLEVEPGPNMTVTGRVHSNSDIYQNPGATLTYQSAVTVAGDIKLGPEQ